MMPSPSLLNSSKTEKHDDLHLWLRGDNIMSVIDTITKDWNILDDRKWTKLSSVPEYDSYKVEGRAHRYRKLAWQPILDKIEREVPIYSQNYKSKYLHGICDSIILYHIKVNFITETYKMIKEYDEEKIQVLLKKRMKEYEDDIQWRKKNNMTIYREDIPTIHTVIRRDDPEYTWKSSGLSRHIHQTEKWLSGSIKNGYTSRDNSDDSYDQYRILIDFKPKLNSISGVIGQLKAYRDCVGPSDLMIITYDKNEKYDPILKDENIHIMRIEETA